MPVCNQTYQERALYEAISDKIHILKSKLVPGVLARAEEPSIVRDPRLKDVTIWMEAMVEPEKGDVSGKHKLEIYFSLLHDAPGNVKINEVRVMVGTRTILTGGSRAFYLERGLPKKIGLSSEPVDLNQVATIAEFGVSFDVDVSVIDFRL